MTRNKKLVKLMALAVAASTVATSVPAYAAFDATYYAQQNPDVVAAIGTKPADLETHYNVFGKKEGRAGSADEAGSALRQLFDAAFYAKMNPDVVAVLGNDPNALFDHFLKFGIKEGRRINPYFDVNAYMKAYPDLVAAFGDDIAAYYNHFANHGISEHRTLGGFPAEKIAPGGSVAYSGGDSSSSGGGGGSSSSKPAPKPADVTPTPDPTPAPTPEPEPEPAQDAYELIDIAIGITNANGELRSDIADAKVAQGKGELTKAVKDSLVTRALDTLSDAEALKTLTAANLEVAEAESEAANKAYIDAQNAVKDAAKTNEALKAFTQGKKIISNVESALNDYYDALDDVETAQDQVDIAAIALATAKAANDNAQKAYDTAYANVKNTVLALDENEKAADLDKAKDNEVVAKLVALAGSEITDNGDGTYSINQAPVAITQATMTEANLELKRKYANQVASAYTQNELIKSNGDVSENAKKTVTRKLTDASNANTLVKAQSLYLTQLLSTQGNYVQIGGNGANAANYVLTEATEKVLKALGFTDAEILAFNGGATNDVINGVAANAIANQGVSVQDLTGTPAQGQNAAVAPKYTAVANKLTADSNEITSIKFKYTTLGNVNTIDLESNGAVSAKSYSEVAEDFANKSINDTIGKYIAEYQATAAGVEYNKAYDTLNGTLNGTANDPNNDGTKKELADAEADKKDKDELLETEKAALKEAADALDEYEDERDGAYAEAGVAGNETLLARDAAVEDKVRENHEYANAQVADAAAKAAYNDAMDNYAEASKLDAD